jgi:ABC-type transport system involved in multi-copper enzyme maturation permease subunit
MVEATRLKRDISKLMTIAGSICAILGFSFFLFVCIYKTSEYISVVIAGCAGFCPFPFFAALAILMAMFLVSTVLILKKRGMGAGILLLASTVIMSLVAIPAGLYVVYPAVIVVIIVAGTAASMLAIQAHVHEPKPKQCKNCGTWNESMRDDCVQCGFKLQIKEP